MKNGLLTLLLILVSSLSYAQVFDDFNDGDFTQNPIWEGDIEAFKVNSNMQLQVDQEGIEGVSYLSTSHHIVDSVSWEFYIKLAFSPSSNNYARVYLSAKEMNLNEPLQAWYLQFGESGSNDAIELFKQEGTVHTSVCRGEEGAISSSFNARIKVIHRSGNWEIYADFNNTGSYSLQCQGADNSNNASSYFGVLCKYTSSNATKFYFDDIDIAYIELDETPPEVCLVSPQGPHQLKVVFSEMVSPETAIHTTNYTVEAPMGHPQSVVYGASQKEVLLDFSTAFEPQKDYEIQISGVCDLSHNTIKDTTITFHRTEIYEFDVVFNEIMADPTPVVLLPDAEYLELYNRTDNRIDLSEWVLHIGHSEKYFPTSYISAHSYVILCKSDYMDLLSSYGQCIGFSSFSLTNTGQSLKLSTPNGLLVHQISYTHDWYADKEKDDGGWSMERIDSEDFCSAKDNWRAALDMRGGSPGEINSVDGLVGDVKPLNIERIEVLDSIKIRVFFNKKMDSISYSNPLYYELNMGIEHPTVCIREAPEYKSVIMLFDQNLQKGIVYTLETTVGLTLCDGSDASGLWASFAIPDKIERGDVVFNEILFDAAIDDGEYIELVNVSDKVLEASSLSLSRLKPNQYDTTWYTVQLSGQLLFPYDYIVYTSSREQVEKVYYSENPEHIISLDHFISLPNDEGQLILHLNGSKDSIVDRLHYDEAWHYGLLTNTKGVSLEKIDLHQENIPENWHSAASAVNYGTPAYENSQFMESTNAQSKFELSPEIFSPDNDGYDDVLQINYQMEMPGFTLNLVIYDSQGRNIKHLVRNELLGTSGSFYWDGQTEDHQKAAIGIYILYFEYFDLEGHATSEKLTTVLGGRL